MTPSADRDTANGGVGPVPVGTEHQVSGPWEKLFGPGGLEAAVGRSEEPPLAPEPEIAPAGSGPPGEASREREPESAAVAPAAPQSTSTDVESVGPEPEATDDWQRVPVQQHVAGLDPRDAPSAGPPTSADPVPDDGPEADPESVARTIVLRKLTAQDRTRAELADALRAKDVPDAVSDRVLDRMEQVGLVDDARFAEAWVRSRQQRRSMSAMALRRELNRKGVDPELTDAAMAQVDPDDEYTAALALAERKFGSMGELAPDVVKRRLAGVLARRGFSSGLVWRVVREVLGETR
ncbi:MAG: RecX family transcriptional regulator [Propionibacteriaceae bacterium]